MFKLKKGENRKVFNLKSVYFPEETFNYDLKVYNHITKSGFQIPIKDINPWLEGVENQTQISVGDKEIFNPNPSKFINNIGNTFVFNNTIQIDGTDFQFHSHSNISWTKMTQLDGNYIIIFNDNDLNEGVLVQVDGSGTTLNTFQFSPNEVRNLNIHQIGNGSVVIGYYDVQQDKSFVKEVHIDNQILYPPTMFFNGWSKNLTINKINDHKFIITYTADVGYIQIVKVSPDHLFSVGFPFIFNNDITLFSDSTYLNNSVVVLYYDIDDQLKVRHCRIFDDYIGIGLPKIVRPNYCYDLNIKMLNQNYCFIVYFNSQIQKIETSMLFVENDITIIDNFQQFDDWSEYLELQTDGQNYKISYMDLDFNGVFREVSVSGGTFGEIHCQYNEFNIDLTNVDLEKNIYHNDYWILYNNEVVEKGILFIKNNNE